MSLAAVGDVLAVGCLLVGALLCLTAGVGLLRFPDVLSRMHAGTKPQVMGILLMTVGAAIRLRGGPVTWMLALVAVFQLTTAPVGAHLVSRVAYRRGHVDPKVLLVDELGGAGQDDAGAPHGDEPADAPAGRPGVDEDTVDGDTVDGRGDAAGGDRRADRTGTDLPLGAVDRRDDGP